MVYLLTALIALAVGPAVLARLERRPALASALDGFVTAAIPGLIFLHFVPAAVEGGDVGILVALGTGLALPGLVERFTRNARARADRWGLLLGITGLAVHATLDGAVLATASGGGADASLALAVILHRLPVGTAVWWLVTRAEGPRAGLAALGSLLAATVLGYLFGGAALAALSGSALPELYQAAVGGSLVHVVGHRAHGSAGASRPRSEGAGALAALALLVAMVVLPGGEEAGPGGFLERLFVLSAESAPALLLAYLFAGLLTAFLPSASIRWMGRGGSLEQAGRGMLVGLPFPVCSCGVVPLYRTLVSRGAPPAAAMAFLVATPELGLDAVLLSIPLLGPEVAAVRVLAAGAAALLVGWWVGGRLSRRVGEPAHAADSVPDPSLGTRMRSAVTAGTGEVVDHTAPWIVLGLMVAALVAPWLEGGWLAALPSLLAVPLFAVLGFPTYVCAASATPLVAALLAGGLSPGAGIAFLITGPATNLSTLGVVGSLHGRGAAAAFAGVLVAFAVSTGILIDLVLPGLPVPTLAALTEEPASALQIVSLAGLAALFAASVVRRGLRRFAGEIRAGLGWDHGLDGSVSHGHAHG
jgi:hypothetical protein